MKKIRACGAVYSMVIFFRAYGAVYNIQYTVQLGSQYTVYYDRMAHSIQYTVTAWLTVYSIHSPALREKSYSIQYTVKFFAHSIQYRENIVKVYTLPLFARNVTVYSIHSPGNRLSPTAYTLGS